MVVIPSISALSAASLVLIPPIMALHIYRDQSFYTRDYPQFKEDGLLVRDAANVAAAAVFDTGLSRRTDPGSRQGRTQQGQTQQKVSPQEVDQRKGSESPVPQAIINLHKDPKALEAAYPHVNFMPPPAAPKYWCTNCGRCTESNEKHRKLISCKFCHADRLTDKPVVHYKCSNCDKDFWWKKEHADQVTCKCGAHNNTKTVIQALAHYQCGYCLGIWEDVWVENTNKLQCKVKGCERLPILEPITGVEPHCDCDTN